MKKRTDKTPALAVVADREPAPVTREWNTAIGRLAAAMADLGYTPEFCRRQPEDRDIWLQIADALDRHPRTPGAAQRARKLRAVGGTR